MILIADAHIRPGGADAAEFFEMLTALERSGEPVIFLGDIFDLWIALPRYESEDHRRFLRWCEQQRKRREIGFIEGNHEFFLARSHAARFTWCSGEAVWEDGRGNVFCHGDRINPRDRNYLMFRRLTKSAASLSVLRWLPFGPLLANKVKKGLKTTNRSFRGYFPEKEILTFAAGLTAPRRRLFLGHFHRAWRGKTEAGLQIFALPLWMDSGRVTRTGKNRGDVEHLHWRELV